MDAQQQHDAAMARRRKKLDAGSRQRLEDLLAKKSASSSTPEQSTAFDPIESAMRQHPTLTREEAEQMARDFGF